jgi:ankyrin repeat protein
MRFLVPLLDRGATFKGTGALCGAAFDGHVAAVHLLLEHGADIEAAANSDVETVEYLIQRGANLHYRDPRQKLTALEVAREREYEECVEVIEKAMQTER